MYKLKKGEKGIAISSDAPKDFKVIDLEKANQNELEFLFKRKHPFVIKLNKGGK